VGNFAGAAQGIATTGLRAVIGDLSLDEALTQRDRINQVMSAERSRRALVTEADGKKQAAITIAEGEKQSAILKAEGDRQAAILRAEGFSLALDRIFSSAKTVDTNTMSLQYLEALKALGAGPATKFVFPMEFTKLLEPFMGGVRGIPPERTP
ncbi:MAG TPA: SPFH domain-containing protein, partial [bacterium]|nr:SPFH domain-containing protein [bacterium]